MHKFKHALYPQTSYFGSLHTYLTVGQANLTVKRGCSHCEQCQEVERSALTQVSLYRGRQERRPGMRLKWPQARLPTHTIKEVITCHVIKREMNSN